MTKRRTAAACAAACALGLLTGAASAADLPIPPGFETAAPLPTFLWTGAYAGVNGGYAFDELAAFAAHADVLPSDGSAARRVNLPSASPKVSDSGATVGGHLGYNFQFGRVLVGVETDADYVDTGRSAVGSIGPLTVTSRAGVDYLGTFRARAGYTFGGLLLYGTAGLAYGDTFASASAPPGSGAGLSRDDVRVGYAAGGGVEFALGQGLFGLSGTRGVTARLEYLHYDLGTSDLGSLYRTTPDGTTVALRDKAHFSGDLARAGLSYGF